MSIPRPYKPRPKRDPRITQMLWAGAYFGLVVGLFAGLALWGLLVLGGAPLWVERGRAVLSLVLCGLLGAVAVAAWVWGYRGLELVGCELVTRTARLLRRPLTRLIRVEEESDREQVAATVGEDLARRLLAWPCGVPLAVHLGLSTTPRPLDAGPTGALLGVGLVGWIVVLVLAKSWLLPPPPPVPPRTGPTPGEIEHARQDEAETDSSLQLAVSRARRAKDAGDSEQAVAILQEALRNAGAAGRSVAHLQVHWMLGWLYADRGDRGAALAMFRAVTELSEPGTQFHEEAKAAFLRITSQLDEQEEVRRAPQRLLPEPPDGAAPPPASPSGTAEPDR